MLKPKKNVTSNEDGSVIMQAEEKGEGTNLNELRCSNAEKGGHVQTFNHTEVFSQAPGDVEAGTCEYLISFYVDQTW